MTANEKFSAINQIAESVRDGINFLGKVILSGNVNFLKGWVVSEHEKYRLMISTSGVHVLLPLDSKEQRVRRHEHIGTLSVSLIGKIGVESPLFNLQVIQSNLKRQFITRSDEFINRAEMMRTLGSSIR